MFSFTPFPNPTRRTQALSAFFALLAAPALAGSEIVVEGAYARSNGPTSPVGAAFMVLRNAGDSDDRLVGVTVAAAARSDLHTHNQGADGVIRMQSIEGSIALPAGGRHVMERGGDHVMMMGLSAGLEDGGTVSVTLIFEEAGEVLVEIPVDYDR